MNTSKKILG